VLLLRLFLFITITIFHRNALAQVSSLKDLITCSAHVKECSDCPTYNFNVSKASRFGFKVLFIEHTGWVRLSDHDGLEVAILNLKTDKNKCTLIVTDHRDKESNGFEMTLTFIDQKDPSKFSSEMKFTRTKRYIQNWQKHPECNLEESLVSNIDLKTCSWKEPVDPRAPQSQYPQYYPSRRER
jgi:hypothetical protein